VAGGPDATNGSTSGTYAYDGDGLRVTKVAGGTTTVYIFAGSKVIAEYDNGAAVASPSREYIYSGSTLLAKVESGATTYYHADHLSARVLTDSSGNTLGQRGHYPFGETWYETGTTTKFKFTTYERDGESGSDYALARYNVNRLGRFSSPDSLPGSTMDPQSLNRYSYVENNPISLADPSGSDPCLETMDDNCIGVTVWGHTDVGSLDPTFNPGYADPSIGGGDSGLSGTGGRPIGWDQGAFNLGGTHQPAPPAGYEDCKKALADAKKGFGAVERAEKAADLIKGAAAANGIDPNLFAAIGVRESGFQNMSETGGQGRGIWQIDIGQHPDAATFASLPDQSQAANYAAGLLRTDYNIFERRFGGNTDTLTAYAVRAYNGGRITPFVQATAGLGILTPYSPIDYGTARNNYVSNVLGLVNCFNF